MFPVEHSTRHRPNVIHRQISRYFLYNCIYNIVFNSHQPEDHDYPAMSHTTYTKRCSIERETHSASPQKRGFHELALDT